MSIQLIIDNLPKDNKEYMKTLHEVGRPMIKKLFKMEIKNPVEFIGNLNVVVSNLSKYEVYYFFTDAIRLFASKKYNKLMDYWDEHDIKNLLNCMLKMVEYVENDNDNDEKLAVFNELNQSLRKIYHRPSVFRNKLQNMMEDVKYIKLYKISNLITWWDDIEPTTAVFTSFNKYSGNDISSTSVATFNYKKNAVLWAWKMIIEDMDFGDIVNHHNIIIDYKCNAVPKDSSLTVDCLEEFIAKECVVCRVEFKHFKFQDEEDEMHQL